MLMFTDGNTKFKSTTTNNNNNNNNNDNNKLICINVE